MCKFGAKAHGTRQSLWSAEQTGALAVTSQLAWGVADVKGQGDVKYLTVLSECVICYVTTSNNNINRGSSLDLSLPAGRIDQKSKPAVAAVSSLYTTQDKPCHICLRVCNLCVCMC